ncbi:MAG: helix-turn-helix domain-containing protein [Armatimonadetes bacterium]|nr:helix-turn-helix domain-containing protein [Armatimonadota bacterium]
MAKIKTLTLSDEERTALDRAWRQGKTHDYRQRCLMVLQKAQGRRSKDVAAQLGCCEPVVNTWVTRYQAEGLAGLANRPGQGRKSILQKDTDLAAVRQAVQASRQRLSQAKAELEQELGKGFSTLTLRRFLKKTVAATNASDAP